MVPGVPRRHLTPKTPVRALRVGLVTAAATVALIGCGGGSSGPPVDVQTPKASPAVGMQDDIIDTVADPTERIQQMAEAGAALIRVELQWNQVAPTARPANPTDPGDPAYVWAPYDRVVEAAKKNKVEVLFAVYGTPAWARDPGVKPPPPTDGVFDFAIRPADPAEFGAFATAAAKRYSPKGVRKWEAWNEPNIKLFLYPQFERHGDRWVATSPQLYSELLKGMYSGIKSVDPKAVVAGGVFAPTGDKCGVTCPVSSRPDGPPNRIRVRDFLTALDQPDLRPQMDVVSHHPYPAAGPEANRPSKRDGIDLYNLEALTTAIDRTYLRGAKVWLTEYGFGTEPVEQNAKSFSPQEQAKNIVDAFQRVRKTPRVEVLVYFFLQDNPGWKSGLRDEQGAPKPGLAAHALPLAINAVTNDDVRLIGQARSAVGTTTVRIEWKSGDTWRKLTEAETLADGTFAVTLKPKEPTTVRALWTGTTRSGTDLTWTSPELLVPALAGR
jgi:polysaccharide biosynthesis protein PslG